jgi:hypothetical protein
MSRFEGMKERLTSATNYLILKRNQKMSTVDTFSVRGPNS